MATGGDDNRILVLGELDALLPAFRRLLQEDCARPQEQAVRQRIEAEFGPQPPILVCLTEGRLVLVQPVPPTAIQQRIQELRARHCAEGRGSLGRAEKPSHEMVSREPIRRQTIADLDGMTGTEFERFLGIIFPRVLTNGRRRRDGTAWHEGKQ